MKKDQAILAAPDYRLFIEELKARVTAARISAARHVNRDLILLYWDTVFVSSAVSTDFL